MALSQSVLFTNASADIIASETGAVRAMAGIMLIIVNNDRWVSPSDKRDHKDLAATLSRIATLAMPKATWEAYAKGCNVIAGKMGDALSGQAVIIGEDDEIDFDGLRDGSEVEAVAGMVRILTTYGATSGGQIRDWAKQDGFFPYDAERVKRERKEKAEAEKAAKHSAADALFLATVGRDSASLPDVVATAPVSSLSAILAALAALTGTERLEALSGLNALLEADAAAVAVIQTVNEVEPPMLPDHVEDEVTIPNKARRQRAVRLAA